MPCRNDLAWHIFFYIMSDIIIPKEQQLYAELYPNIKVIVPNGTPATVVIRALSEIIAGLENLMKYPENKL